jgi:hypothetical protein
MLTIILNIYQGTNRLYVKIRRSDYIDHIQIGCASLGKGLFYIPASFSLTAGIKGPEKSQCWTTAV